MQRSASEVKNAMTLAKRTSFTQEVCGEYIDESKKFFLDNFGSNMGLMAGLCAIPIVGLGACAALVPTAIAKVALDAQESMNANTDGRVKGSTFSSYLADDTARHVTNREYR